MSKLELRCESQCHSEACQPAPPSEHTVLRYQSSSCSLLGAVVADVDALEIRDVRRTVYAGADYAATRPYLGS